MHIRACLLGVALTLAQSAFSQVSQSALPVSDPNSVKGSAGVEVPFKLYRDYLIVVHGSLGELEGLNFLVDTGVNPTEVDDRIARKFPSLGKIHTLGLLDQEADVRQVLLPRLQLGPILAKSVPAVIQDLSPLKQAAGVRIDAVVGLDVLSLSSFSIDYRTKKILFGPIDSSGSAVPFDTGPPIVTVELTVKGDPVRLLVDTGAADLVLFHCHLHGRLRQLPVSGMTQFRVNGANKESGLVEVWLPETRLATTDLGLQRGLEAVGNANCSRSFDGVVGMRSLGLKWVAFDFEHGRFSWKR